MGVGDVSEIVPDNFTFERSDALVCHVHYYGSGAQVCVCVRARATETKMRAGQLIHNL